MRIATYNIGAGQYCHTDMSILAGELNKHHIDLLSLQEVDKMTGRSGKINQLEALKNDHTVFAKFHKAIDFDGGEYGLGFLSTLSVEDSNHALLESSNFEQRILQKFSIKMGDKRVSFYNTHLTYEDAATRKDQMKYLKSVLDRDSSEFKIVTGDFNIANCNEFDLFLEDYNLVNGYNNMWYDTFPGENEGSHRLDNIILSKNIRINHIEVIENNHSDHFMLLVDVEF